MKSGASDPFADEGSEEGEVRATEEEEVRTAEETGAAEETEPVERAEGVEGESVEDGTAKDSVEDDAEELADDAEELADDPVDDELDGEIERSDIPWVLRRDTVKDDRPHVHQLFVREDTDGRARRAESRLEERLGRDVYRLDAREAIYLVGMQHLDEVTELLEEWGYDL